MRQLLTLAVLFVIGLQVSYAQLTTISGPSSVQTGEFACYDFPITWSSTTENVVNGKIEIVLPAPLSDNPSDVNFNTPPFVASSTYNQATRTITWILESPFFAGSSANLHFCTKFPNGSTANGAMVTLTPTFTRTGAAAQSINTNLTAMATSKVKITKTILKNPALNNDAVFLINVENPNELGNLDLTNVMVSDPLPVGVNFVSASNGGSLVGSSVQWNIASLPVGTTKTLRMTVQYLSPFTLGSTSTNTATLTAVQVPAPGISASKDITVSPPDPSGSFSKSPFAICPSLGASAGWNIGVQNTGNVPLTDVVVEDMLPAEFFLNNSLTVAADANGNPATVTVEYQTVANSTYTTWPGSPLVFPANPVTPTNQSLTAPGGSPITKVRLTWNSIAVGYASGVSMSGIVNSPDKLGGIFSAGPTPATGHKITNTITNDYKFNNIAQPQVSVNADLTIVAQLPKPVVYKSLQSNYDQEPGNEVTYQLCISNANDAVGNLVDPIIADLLPTDVEYIAGSISNVNGPLGTPTLTESVNAATGRPLLKFTWPSGASLSVGQSTCFNIKVKIKAGAPAGIRSNKLFFLPTTTLNLCDNQQQEPDVLDIDNDANTSEIVPSTNNVDFNVIHVAAVASAKWVKGLCDTTFHRFPTVGKTTSYTDTGTGTFQYKLIIQNLGNEPLKDIRIMDILPWSGDVGVITINNPRNSTFAPVFVSMDVVPAGITPKYSTTSNPLRTDLDPTLPSPAGAVAGNFTTVQPTNLADIKSILFDFGNTVLAPAESREILMTLRVPYGVTPSDIAWNSFGHRTDVNANAGVPKPIPAEPIKVGIQTKSAKIGDYVWIDNNKNGIQDDGNTGLGGVTVHLLDATGSAVISPDNNLPVTTVTDSNGKYCFGVAPGTYMVKFDIPVIYSPTTKDATTDDNDSDADATGKTASVTVADGDINLTLDAGVIDCGTGSIGDKIWKDINDNGIQDGGAEVGVDGITLNLYAADANGNKVGAILQTKTTSGGGMYLFTEIGKGDYVIEIDKNQILAMGMQLSQKLNQTNDAFDNDFIYASGLTEKISIDPCDEGKSNIRNVDGAIASLGTIGDRIWKDTNNNGVQDGGELGVDGVTMKLYLADANGSPIGGFLQTKITSNGGLYKFENLLEGMYVVELDKNTIMSPMELSLKPNTGNDDFDSDFNPGNGLSEKITVVPSNPNQKDITNVDAGIVTLGSIGDKIWKDYNNNGVQDASPNEEGINGVTLNLYLADANGNKVGGSLQTKVTSLGGTYKFTQLAEGMYVVEIDQNTIMAPMEISRKPNTGNDNADSDFNPDNGLSSKVTVVPNDPTQRDITNIDGGIVTLGSIGDRIWKDSNNNGIQDGGEFGVGGVDMELYLADNAGNPIGAAIQTTMTDGNGLYKFKQLDEGMYTVRIVKASIMASMEITKKTNVGADDNADSDFNRFSGFSPKVTVVPNNPAQKDITNVDGAIRNRIRGTIGDYVWKDLIENGIQEACEKGVPNVTLEIYMKDPINGTAAIGRLDTITGIFTPNVPMFTTTTNAAGKYLFSNLEDETYVVKVVKSTLMANMEMSPLQNQGTNDALDNDFNVSTALSDLVPLDPYVVALRHNLTIDAAIRNTPCNTLTSETAAFAGTGASANGAITVGNTSIGMTVAATGTQILRSTQDRASTLFGDNCYTTKPTSGGSMTLRDNGGNGLVTINFGAVVSNPILYFKDIARRKLDLSSSVDANGNPICMRKISGNGDVQVNEMMMMIQDNNPAQVGALNDPIAQSCGLVQMIGDFSSIKIQSTALNGAADNWTFGIASDDYHCGVHPEILPLMAKKKVANIVPKDPANPAGNKIVTFVVELENKTKTKYNNLFVENYLDEKWGNAIVGITSAPVVTWPMNSVMIQGNPSFNGTTEVNLLSKTINNMMIAGDLIRIQYSVELNPALINPTARHENRLIAGSTSQPVFLANFEECNLPVYLPLSTQLPTNPVVEIAGGTADVEFASWLQCFGKSMVTPHPQCGKVTWGYDMCEKPFTEDCGTTGTHHTLFRGMDKCGNMYMWRADFKSEDKSKPIWDMLPMDKVINCDDKDASATLTMWLNSAGGAWFSDPGSIAKPKVSSDFNGTSPNCASGPRTITFTLTDQCKNTTTASAKLSITDTKAPSIKNVGANITVNCGDKYSFSSPIAEDNCGNAALTFVDSGSDDCTKDNKKTRVWTATDGCGNTATASQTIFFNPTVIEMRMTNVISDKIISCSDDMIFDKPTFETSCTNKTISSSYTDEKVNGGCESEIDFTRHWIFWDQCGAKYEVNQTISISDSEAPTFVGNLPKTFTMKKSLFNVWKKLYFENYVKANDNCSKVTISAPIMKILSSKSVECTVVANDQCGNLTKYACVVNFEDIAATSKEGSEGDTQANAIVKELEKFVTDETPIDVPIEAVIYPNPTSRVVNVVPAQGYGDLQKIHIFNLSGQVLLNMDVEGTKNQLITIDISNFANATYIIEMVHPMKKLYRQVQKIQ